MNPTNMPFPIGLMHLSRNKRSGSTTAKPSVTSPPQPKIQRTPFGPSSQVRRTCTPSISSIVPVAKRLALFPTNFTNCIRVSKVCRSEWRSRSSPFPPPFQVRRTCPLAYGFWSFKKTSLYNNYVHSATSGHIDYPKCDPPCGAVAG